MGPADPLRLRLYGYLTAPESADYLTIMSRFTDALLAEWSSEDLVDRDLDLPVETIEARCRYLAEHGNLLISPREVRVTSIAEYQRQPARYAVSALGARLHREVQAFLAATGGAREVPQELLALVAAGLVALADGPGRNPTAANQETLAGSVSTIFGQSTTSPHPSLTSTPTSAPSSAGVTWMVTMDGLQGAPTRLPGVHCGQRAATQPDYPSGIGSTAAGVA